MSMIGNVDLCPVVKRVCATLTVTLVFFAEWVSVLYSVLRVTKSGCIECGVTPDMISESVLVLAVPTPLLSLCVYKWVAPASLAVELVLDSPSPAALLSLSAYPWVAEVSVSAEGAFVSPT